MLARGRAVSGLGWKLVGWEQDRQLGLDLESPSGYGYSGQVSFAASRDGPADCPWIPATAGSDGHKVAFSDF